MLSDQIFELVGLVGLQKLVTDISLWKVVATIISLGIIGIVVDYARMLLLRAKMVLSPSNQPPFPTTSTDADLFCSCTAPGAIPLSYRRQHLHATGP